MSRARRLAFIVFLLSLLTILPYATAYAQAPSVPPAFWGGVEWLDGGLAPPGAPVKAMQGKGTTSLGEGVVEAGAGSSRFRLTSRPPT